MRAVSRTAILSLAVLAATASLSAQQALDANSTGDVLVTCAQLVLDADTVVENGAFLVRDGKIAFVGAEIPREAKARARSLAFPGATITPGFVLAHTTLDLERDLAERAVALTPEMLAKDAFDPADEKLLRMPRQCITSAGLSPSSTNLAGGVAALVSPGSSVDPSRKLGFVQKDEIYAKFSLVGAARNPERQPTSLMGAVDMLRGAFVDARTGTLAGEPAQALNAVARGERRAVFHVDTRAEILAALAVCKAAGIDPILAGAADATDCIDEIAAARASLLLGTLAPEARDDRLQLPARLEQKGIPFCFSGDPSLLRSSAAIAVANGCSKKRALAALTTTPASFCGVGSTHGALRVGCDADFAVFSGDPLDLTSRVIAVYGDGALLHEAKAQATTTKEPN